MRHSLSAGFAALVSSVASCSPEEARNAVQASSAAAPAAAASAALDEHAEGTIFHLEGRSGTPANLWVEASYKIRRDAGKISKTLQIDVEHAPPGVTHALTLDDFKLGKVVTSSKGKASFELTESGEVSFPEGFKEPKEGSLVRVGELAEIHLQTVHKLTDLQLDISGPDGLTGKAGYKVERLGDTTTTEFQVKVTKAEVKSVHPVLIDGVHAGDLTVDLTGKGKLLYSSLEGEPFPPGFQAPHAGSTIAIGQVFKGQLRDNLAGRGQ